MKKWLPMVRMFLLLVAVTIMAIGFVPDRTTAEVLDGPCSDDGCMGGGDFCDYVVIEGGVYPCNMPAVE